MTAVPLRTVARAVALLAAVGIAREAWFHLVAEPVWRLGSHGPRSDERYVTVREALPARGRVGYVSDEPVSTRPGALQADEWGTWLYQSAQYALAPLVLAVGDSRAEVVLANLKDPARLEEVARAHGLRIERRFEGGSVAVLRK